MKKFLFLSLAFIASWVLSSCASSGARGWSTSCADGGWSQIAFSERVDFALLWEDVTSIVSKRFEMEMAARESGYIRTKWDYRFATNGKTVDNYRTRVTLKLNERRKVIEVKSEAEKLKGKYWISGCDTRLQETMKEDLRGISDY